MRVPTAALIAGFILATSLTATCFAPPASAGDCPGTAQCSGLGLGLGGALGSDTAEERANARLGAGQWIAEPWQAAPFMLKESAPSYSVRTSLAHYFTYREQRKLGPDVLADAGLSPGDLSRRPAAAPPVDVWTMVDFDRQGDDGLVRGRVGADLRLDRATVVGVALERGELVNGDDERVVTYFKQRIATGFTWSLKGGFGHGLVQSDTAAGAVENAYFNAQVARDWQLAGLKLTPTLELQTNIGSLDGAAGGASWTHGEVVVGNKVSRSFDLGARTLEPFVAITQSLDAASGEDAGQKLESGLKLEAPSQFTFSASTAVKRSETDGGDPALSGRVELKVPLD